MYRYCVINLGKLRGQCVCSQRRKQGELAMSSIGFESSGRTLIKEHFSGKLKSVSPLRYLGAYR